MPKLTLVMDDLRVESFETTRAVKERGTVFGEECTCATCTCPGCPTCDATCHQTCDDQTCTCGFTCQSCSCLPCYSYMCEEN